MRRSITYRFTAALCLAVALGIGVHACTRTQERNVRPLIKVRFADVPNPLSAAVYVALEKGFFKGEGLEVSYLSVPSGKQALQEVVDGKADFAAVADLPIVFQILKANRVNVIAVLCKVKKLYAIVGRKDKGISSAHDLRGKRVGAARGTSPEYFLDTLLLFNHIPRRDVRIIDVAPERWVDALMKGDVDAVSVWEPIASELRTRLGDNAFVFYADEQPLYTNTWNVAAMQDFVQKNPDAVTRLLRALLKAETFTEKNREEARQIMARYGFPGEGSREWWNAYRSDISLSPLLVENLESQTNWAIRNGFTDRKDMPNYLDYIYFKGLESVKPEAVTIVH
jgi:ABC-type nitrate/sulfonate/bicarbonate transport system substrate-binding protein